MAVIPGNAQHNQGGRVGRRVVVGKPWLGATGRNAEACPKAAQKRGEGRNQSNSTVVGDESRLFEGTVVRIVSRKLLRKFTPTGKRGGGERGQVSRGNARRKRGPCPMFFHPRQPRQQSPRQFVMSTKRPQMPQIKYQR